MRACVRGFLILLLATSGALGNEQGPKICYALEQALPSPLKPALLVFFSTECSSCWDDLLEMRYFVDKNGLDVQLVGIAAEPEQDVLRFAEKHAFFHPVVIDKKKRIHRSFHVGLIPYKVILIGNRVRYRDDYDKGFSDRRKEAQSCLLAVAR